MSAGAAVVIRAGRPDTATAVRDGLVAAFERTQAAVLDGAGVVLVVEAGDLLGQHGPQRGAYTAGLVGLARALAFEGAKPGWSVNVLAVPAGRAVPDDEAADRVAGLSGQVVTLGTALVGKVAP